MTDVSEVVDDFIRTAAPGSKGALVSDVTALLGGEKGAKLVESKLREHFTRALRLDDASGDALVVDVDGRMAIVSAYNRDDKGLKFVDHSAGVKFAYDFSKGRALDVEESCEPLTDSDAALQAALDAYVSNHYVENSRGMVIPGHDTTTVVIVGERRNEANFYNGKWTAVYEVRDKNVAGLVKVAVHYFEDGNVMLKSGREVERTIADGAGAAIDAIEAMENDFEIALLQEITRLNEDTFKGLRRLLPISRSKIQWGKAIGNYKLGRDVVEG